MRLAPKMPEAARDLRFRGYWVKTHPLTGLVWVERDGFLIGHAATVEEGRRIIELLTNPQQRGADSMRFLVNPGTSRDNKGGGMARKTPPRYKSGPKKGQFMPKGARKRRRTRKNPIVARASSRTAPKRTATGQRRATSYAAPARRYTARRNPPRRDMLDTLTNGALGAGAVLVGKAAVRSLPQLLSLPQAGNVGLAVQAATAVAVGWIADRFIGRDVGEMMLAGGLSAPMESLAIRLNIPWVSTALASAGTVSGYANRRGGGIVVWDAPPAASSGIAGYVPARTGRAPAYSYN